MKENGSKRREWVKTAAIIFLSVLLVLTFFSNTIMNYSLPEVATQYVESGTITAKIRGGGVVESNDPYEVTVKETRKVTSVAVRKGDMVEKDDVLVYLEDAEGEELKNARDALKNAWKAYDLALLSAEVNATVLANSQTDTTTTAYRNRITAAQKRADTLQDRYDALQAKIDLTPAKGGTTADSQTLLTNARKAKENAEFHLTSKETALTAAQNNLTNLESRILLVQQSVSDGDAEAEEQLPDLLKSKTAAEWAILNAQIERDAAATAASDARLYYDMISASGDNTDLLESLTNQQKQAKNDLDAANKDLMELLSDISQTYNLGYLYEDVTKAQDKVNELEENAIGATVKAEVSGTIMAINATAGQDISAAEPVAVIQPEGKGYTMQFSVTNDQAKRLSVGDRAELVNAWYFNDLEVTLAQIKPDPQDPGQKKLLTFEIAGEVTPGQSLNVSVGQKSANYDLIVPNSAIREDNNGKFILIVETKSTPLSNRYIAKRVDVEVLAGDDMRSAVSGALYGYEYVITTSTAPVEAGKQVRLTDK